MLKENQEEILRMDGIVKCYGDLVADDHVNLTLHKQEILAVIGENGAGKTTLMKVLYGLEQPDSGDIYVRGEKVQIRNAGQAIANGIGMVQQHFMLFEPFTVAENVVYGHEPQKGLFFDEEAANQIIRDLSKKYELPLDPKAKIEGMPVGLRQRVEIMKVLFQNTDIIVFDEPTAVLTPQEVHELLQTMKQLAEAGKSIIIITHKLNEVMEVADRAIVMRLGKRIADLKISDTSIEELSFLMVGHKLIEKNIPEKIPGKPILQIENLCLQEKGGHYILDHINMHVDAGEIVGIAGVSGNGQSELAQCIFGLEKADSGSIQVENVEIFNKPVKDVREAGTAMIPEDRMLWGSASQATISETAIMGHYEKPEFSKDGILNISSIRKFASSIVKKFSVKTDSILQRTSSLSGGNAQKLVVAREMSQNTPLLLACEPTRGIDIGATEYIHEQLIEKRTRGDAVLLISSELTEILRLSDRIYVMYEGRINGEFSRGDVTEEVLGLQMVGGKKNELA